VCRADGAFAQLQSYSPYCCDTGGVSAYSVLTQEEIVELARCDELCPLVLNRLLNKPARAAFRSEF
jgi:hypothetical protein